MLCRLTGADNQRNLDFVGAINGDLKRAAGALHVGRKFGEQWPAGTCGHHERDHAAAATVADQKPKGAACLRGRAEGFLEEAGTTLAARAERLKASG